VRLKCKALTHAIIAYLSLVNVLPATRLLAVPGAIVFAHRSSGCGSFGPGGGNRILDVVLVAARDAEHLDFGIVVVVGDSAFALRLFRRRSGFLQRLDVVCHRLSGIGGGFAAVVDISLRLLLQRHLEELVFVAVARHRRGSV